MGRERLGGQWACKERGPVFKVGDHADSSVGSISVQIPQIGCNLAPGAQIHTNPFQLIKSRQISRPDPVQPNRLAGRRLSPPYFLVWIDCSLVRFSSGPIPPRRSCLCSPPPLSPPLALPPPACKSLMQHRSLDMCHWTCYSTLRHSSLVFYLASSGPCSCLEYPPALFGLSCAPSPSLPHHPTSVFVRMCA